mmetsp:Transcript_25009/g.28936  ORF Transcript_25009/g.28936 Transcript_25009/m.28936 type:complete len:223 (-) Transcript_25009:48-716(-)
MSRYTPYISKQPENWQDTITELNSIRLFLVNTLGPTVFVLKADDMTEITFKVFIGERQMCSCGGGDGRGKLCLHIVFVMVKVLRVPANNPLSWQLSLVDSEVNSILSGEILSRDKSNIKPHHGTFLRKGKGERWRKKKSNSKDNEINKDVEVVNSKEEGYMVIRKDIQTDEICCICQEEMSREDLEADILCFCESQCGTNFHKRCFRMYATYNRSEKKVVEW